MSRPSIVSAGYMPIDVIRTPSGTVGRHACGTAANVAAILAYLGWDAVLAGQAGSDTAGDELVRDLRRGGVDVGQITRAPNTQTPRLVHDVRPEGHFYRYGCSDCGARFPRSRPLTLDGAEACAQAHPEPTVFFFDRANPGTLALAEHYATMGTIIVELSVPANAELLRRAAAVAQVIKHSDDRSVGGLDDLHVRPRSGHRFPARPATVIARKPEFGEFVRQNKLSQPGIRGQVITKRHAIVVSPHDQTKNPGRRAAFLQRQPQLAVVIADNTAIAEMVFPSRVCFGLFSLNEPRIRAECLAILE